HESVDGWTGAGGRGASGVSGDPAGGRSGGHGGPSAIFVGDPGMDGASLWNAWHFNVDQLREPLGAAAVHVPAGAGLGDERSGVAGDYSGTGSGGATCVGSSPEFGGIQRSTSRGTGVRRH